MAQVLLLTARQAGRKPASPVVLQSIVSEHSYGTAAITDIAIRVVDGKVTMRNTAADCALEDYDFIHFRNVVVAPDYFKAIALYLNHHTVPFIEALDVASTGMGKLSQMVALALAGVTVPDTFAVWPGDPVGIRSALTLPFICKANQGIGGRNNYLIRSWEQYDELMLSTGHSGYVAQPFIANTGDYRVLYMGQHRMIFFRSGQQGSHLNNTSQQGSARLIAEADCDPEVLAIGEQAMRVTNRQIGGVDVLVSSETGVSYILEVNDTPALLTGFALEEKAALYDQFITDFLHK